MTGRRYYITSLADWHRHAARFANSHWLALDDATPAPSGESPSVSTDTSAAAPASAAAAARILVLVEADEGVHLALEDDSAFEALPHPLASKPISAAAQAALATHGVAPGATTFDATELVSRAHPLLRHRVF